MPRVLYVVDNTRDVERIWDYTQARDLAMYRTRITATIIEWVVDLEAGTREQTRFLLEFGDRVTNIMGTYYV